MPISAKHGPGRIFLIVFVGLFAMSSYFVISGYYRSIEVESNNQLEKLNILSRTLSREMEGGEVQELMHKFPNKDDISNALQDEVYRKYHIKFKGAAQINGISSPIYTIHRTAENNFVFGITSNEETYFRHTYLQIPELLMQRYETGGTINEYEDEHGTWLTAFSPIFDGKGEVVGSLHVDKPFDDFLAEARAKLLKQILFSVAFLVLVALVMFRFLSKTLAKEEMDKEKMRIKNSIIKQKNMDITASINYARRLQLAIRPDERKIENTFKGFFSISMPKDIVTGDFIWYHEDAFNKSKIFVHADCTGHGVPGAMMSMLGNSFLNEIVSERRILDPKKILIELDKKLAKSLQQEESTINDGMDITVVTIDKDNKALTFSGANNNLVVARLGELIVLKGKRYSIGDGFALKHAENEVFNLQTEDILYSFSDGYKDQFGGPLGKKMSTKTFYQVIKQISNRGLAQQKEAFVEYFDKWKGSNEQVDDVSLVGLRF